MISQEAAARRIEDALRLRVGRGRRYSFQGLADATGIPQRTVESYTQGATPGLANLLSLAAVLGPSFTTDVLAECGQVARIGCADAPEHMRIVGTMGTLVAEITEAVSDGHVDHREAAELRHRAAELIELLTPLATSGRAA